MLHIEKNKSEGTINTHQTEGHAVIPVHAPVIYMFAPRPLTPVRSVSHLSLLLTLFFLFCNSECVCGKKRLYVCLCGLVFLSVSMCLWLRWLFPLPENVLRQESGLEKVSAALSICDVVPNWARSHFRLAWSNTAHAQRKHCQKVVEC